MAMKPMVYFWINDGGIGDVEIVSGEVDVVFIDWDEVKRGDSREYIEQALLDAARLPETYSAKGDIVQALAAALADRQRFEG